MTYPPQIPPDNRLNTTPQVDNHPDDHNVISDALTDILNELGNNPKGTFADVEARLDAVLPAGVIMDFGGTVAPPSWVLTDGASYDGTLPTYFALWSAIGLTFGGTGQSDFQVPDIQGRMTIGTGQATEIGGPDRVIGEAFGRVDGWTVNHHHNFQKNTGTFGAAAGGSGNAWYGTGGTGSTGGVLGAGTVFESQADLNMPPFLVVTKIIRL